MKEENKNARHRLADVVPLSVPFIMYIDPSGRCNFKCRFCPTNNSSYQAEERHKVMSFKLFEKIADDLAEFEEQVKVVNLFGFGEPLLNPHVPDMIALLKQRDLCREVRIYTNGALLTPELNAKLVANGTDLIRISIEALSSDGYKDVCGASLNYDRFVGNVKDLYERSRGSNTKVSAKIISSTLKNSQDVDKFIEIYEPISDYYFVEAEENYWVQYDNAVTDQSALGFITKTHEKSDEICNHVCSSPLTELAVFANGKVGICSGDWRMDTIIGDATLQSLQDIWKGDALHEFRMKHLSGRRNELATCDKCLMCSRDDIDADAEEVLRKLLQRRNCVNNGEL